MSLEDTYENFMFDKDGMLKFEFLRRNRKMVAGEINNNCRA